MIIPFFLKSQIPIPPSIFGQNAWFIENTDPNPSASIPWNDVKVSGVKYVRIGGIGANFTPLYTFETNTGSTYLDILSASKLINVINAIRNNGMEPIIQVSFDPITKPGDCSTDQSPMTNMSITDQATIAGKLVSFLNNPATGVYKTNPIKYWSISNEPDLVIDCTNPKGFSYDGSSANNAYIADAGKIAAFITAFASEMKHKDPTIKIIGPELAKFGNDKGIDTGTGAYWNPVNPIMNELISDPGTNNSNANSIMGKILSAGPGYGQYFIDVISFHYYPNYTNATTARADVIGDPTKSINGFKGNIIDDGLPLNDNRGIIEMIKNNNTGRTIDNLKIACTEFNLENAETHDESSTGGHSTMSEGFGNRSFIAGQWLAEVFANAINTFGTNSLNQKESWVEFMNFWSVIENGTSSNGCTDGKGYISNCATTPGKYRSTYNHF